MSDFVLVRENGRTIPKEDKNFGISNRAKAAIKEFGRDAVINSTIGTLNDDDGELIVMKSVDQVFRTLGPKDYAEYAPIGGTKGFREAVVKAAFQSHVPEGFVEAVATPGGTGSLRNAVSNYSSAGDSILTTDWHWSPYKTIVTEIGRKLETFELFTEDRKFNIDSFRKVSSDILSRQESLVIILNTPAHNPTGYSLTLEDWDAVIAVLTEEAASGKSIALVVDVAYMDFAGEEEKYREFIPKLSALPENVLPIIAYSLSKTFTLYGTRCGATLCIAKTREIAEEFRRACEFSARGSWSNSTKMAQVILEKIYGDEELLKSVSEERAFYRNMLIARGRAFSEEAERAGLEIVPFDAGFFISVPCDDPDGVSARLEKEKVFVVPLSKGLRISVASVSEKACRKLPAIIKAAL